jgi:hypothetical protein
MALSVRTFRTLTYLSTFKLKHSLFSLIPIEIIMVKRKLRWDCLFLIKLPNLLRHRIEIYTAMNNNNIVFICITQVS